MYKITVNPIIKKHFRFKNHQIKKVQEVKNKLHKSQEVKSVEKK